MASEANAAAPRRRLYSPELKSQVVALAREPGASVAGVALAHGINANIVHRWLRERTRQAPAQSGFLALSMAPVNAQVAPQADAPAMPPGGHPKCSTYGHPNCSTLATVI